MGHVNKCALGIADPALEQRCQITQPPEDHMVSLSPVVQTNYLWTHVSILIHHKACDCLLSGYVPLLIVSADLSHPLEGF